MQLNLRVDIEGALRKFSVTKAESRKAIVRALNKTATTAKAEAARDIRDAGYGLKIGEIKKAISIRRANNTVLTAKVRATGRPIPLIKYSARPNANGVMVKVKEGRKLVPHAFIATMPSGHKGVFLRKGTQHKKVMQHGRAVWSGLPIFEVFGPSIPAAFSNEVVQRALIEQVKERFPVVLRQELRYLASLH